MKILIAPDSFKECLSAKEVGKAIERGIKKVLNTIDTFVLPMADGGEGTVESLTDASKGEIVRVRVHDPLMRKIDAFYGILGDKKTAVIEMAAASGLGLLAESEKNPWITTTYGTGELIRDAIQNGCKRIIIGIGGSATNDGGAGMFMALGGKLLDKQGNSIGWGGGALSDLERIDFGGLLTEIQSVQITVACDVTNPLTGPKGASYIYGPQKGANADMVKELDLNLHYFAVKIKELLHMDIEKIPGSGAAGGLGAGLMTFLNARLEKGFDLIKEIVQLENQVKNCDVVITGEGKIDFQTQFGKTPMGVVSVATLFNKPVIAVAGALGDKYEELYEKGFGAILAICEKPCTIAESISNAKVLLEDTGERIARLLLMGNKLNL
jgi:glycerate 2-kinase